MPKKGGRSPPRSPDPPDPPIQPTRNMPRTDRMATEPEIRYHRPPGPDPALYDAPRVQAAAPAPAAPAPLAKTPRQHAAPQHPSTSRSVPTQAPTHTATAARRATTACPPAPASRAPSRVAPPTTRAPVSSSARPTRPTGPDHTPQVRLPASSNLDKTTPRTKTPPNKTPTSEKTMRLKTPMPAAYASPAPPRSSARDSPAMRSACSSRVGSDASLSSTGSYGLCAVPYVTPVRAAADPTGELLFASSSLPELPLPRQGLEEPLPFTTSTDTLGSEQRAQRRPRSPEEDAAEEAKRPCTSSSQPQRDPRRQRTTTQTTPTASFSEVAMRTPPPTAAAPVQPTAVPSGSAQAAAGKPFKKLRYPPLVVEHLPNWAQHFKAIRDKLGRPPCARPYQKGIRFVPESEEEFRLVQRYLTDLETRENIAWFSYSLPAELSLKVAITGLPADTAPQDIEDELRALGFEPEYVRHIKARQGRPGCVFHAMIRKTPNFREVYGITMFMNMRGVKIESWRGKRGPAQCHRCQLFRHSSHLCHRPLACVRCGEEHSAKECPRPLSEPPTCANCAGPHPANHYKCPIYQREARNRRAGTVAKTAEYRPRTQVTERSLAQPCADEARNASLMATANAPTARGATPDPQKRRKRKRGGKKRNARPAASEAGTQGMHPAQADLAPPPPPTKKFTTTTVFAAASTVKGGAARTDRASKATASAPKAPRTQTAAYAPRQQQHSGGAAPAGQKAPTTPEEYRKHILGAAIRVLQDVLNALMTEQDPVPVILAGMATLFTAG